MKALAVTLAVVLASLLATTSSAAATAPTQPASFAAAAAAEPTCDSATWVGIADEALVPARRPINLRCALRRGDFNNFGVVALQNTLVKCYGQNIAIDADFGHSTERALIMAQTWERTVHAAPSLTKGVYDSYTFYALRWPYHKNADLNARFKCLY